ncbi:hypothetical protein P152DRAFT_505388 [Eremomyces bilateralis CBS 781.70]|uniref:Fe2OG dioxygenase domain-containing protein n=1 Tax=Eremomyces bilateralis CBS 781.70 TaxID=1392243 RepID=A0A6G1GC56_9PEZI|nr:uncharacterized protein P152DRAFT_505388 [Eremomyces bilateralis CBS 781.70]KAF1815481.1 hypothetical protein P152DRAFT_505388 [Eremomyces bilateralis CBS 781.70]
MLASPAMPDSATGCATQAACDHIIVKCAVESFDPDKHLAFKEAPEILTMKDIGYPEDTGVSPVAMSQPFQLFTKEAVDQMRQEIFKKEVNETCQFRSNIAASQLRGYAGRFAPFTYDAWTHPKTLAIMSKIAGVELTVVVDYEIGHINFAVKSKKQVQQEIDMINAQKCFFASDEGISGCPWEDDKPVVGWHRDSYPFVCVLMLSDCTNMVGGETAIQKPDGTVIRVRGPGMGSAIILQGRYITHQALRALGTRERITSVTSFRPKDPFAADATVLNTVRQISDVSMLYHQFAEYRLQIMEDRIRAKLREMERRQRAGKKFATSDFKAFLKEQTKFLAHMNSEMVDEDMIASGYIEEMNIPDVVVDVNQGGMERPTKRTRTD